MSTTKVEFTNQQGHSLTGILEKPEGEPKGCVLFAHCFTCGKSMGIVRNIAKQLTDENLALLRFDFTGLGQSEGEFAQTSFTSNLSDLHAAAEYLENTFMAPGALVGHSLGGAAVLATAKKIDSVRCVATIGAPSDPVHVRHLMGNAEFDADDTAEISIGGRPFRIGKEFIEDLEKHDLATEIASLGKPLLICHSPLDSIVGIDNA
ncbi:MAG: alpha/beta fold hydrolase, partial [Planctomycetota bacterium]|nr:alpha/beta fold hydrolase [Planctomycetota bacterium]